MSIAASRRYLVSWQLRANISRGLHFDKESSTVAQKSMHAPVLCSSGNMKTILFDLLPGSNGAGLGGITRKLAVEHPEEEQ